MKRRDGTQNWTLLTCTAHFVEVFPRLQELKCGKYVRDMRKRPPRGSLRVCQRLEDQRTRSVIHVRLVRDEIPADWAKARYGK